MANLTAKELSAIGDHLAMEENIVRKYRMYASTTQDPAIKRKCEEIAQRHQTHFDTLMGHLN